ncbi:MAG: hypothetical protein ACREBD_32140 [Blastocatellia bacterium]
MLPLAVLKTGDAMTLAEICVKRPVFSVMLILGQDFNQVIELSKQGAIEMRKSRELVDEAINRVSFPPGYKFKFRSRLRSFHCGRREDH